MKKINLTLYYASTQDELWLNLIKDAEKSLQLELPSLIRDYLITTLITYTTNTHWVDQCIAEHYCAARENHDLFLFQSLGDICLLKSGFLNSPPPYPNDYLVAMGQIGYNKVDSSWRHTLPIHASKHNHFAYLELNFCTLVLILKEINIKKNTTWPSNKPTCNSLTNNCIVINKGRCSSVGRATDS
jgi:hypothetical protein